MASTQFVHTIGGTIGVAFMGTILNAQVAQRSAPIFAGSASATSRLPTNVTPANVLLTPNINSLLPADFLQQLQNALAQSLFWVYLVVVALMLISLMAMFLFPGGRADEHAYKDEGEEPAEMIREVSLVG